MAQSSPTDVPEGGDVKKFWRISSDTDKPCSSSALRVEARASLSTPTKLSLPPRPYEESPAAMEAAEEPESRRQSEDKSLSSGASSPTSSTGAITPLAEPAIIIQRPKKKQGLPAPGGPIGGPQMDSKTPQLRHLSTSYDDYMHSQIAGANKSGQPQSPPFVSSFNPTGGAHIATSYNEYMSAKGVTVYGDSLRRQRLSKRNVNRKVDKLYATTAIDTGAIEDDDDLHPHQDLCILSICDSSAPDITTPSRRAAALEVLAPDDEAAEDADEDDDDETGGIGCFSMPLFNNPIFFESPGKPR